MDIWRSVENGLTNSLNSNISIQTQKLFLDIMPLHIIISINIIEGGKKGEKQASKTTPHFNFGGNLEDF